MSEKEIERLARVRAKRGGNRSVMTKLIYEAEGLLEVEPIDKQRMKIIADSLDQKLTLVKSLDEEVIETCNVEEIVKEIEDSDEINSRVMEMLRKINDVTSPKQNDQGISTLSGKKDEENTTSISLQSTGPIPVVSPVNTSSTLDSGNDQNLQVPGTLTPSTGMQSSHVPSNNQAGNTQEPGSSGMAFQLPTNLNTNATAFQPKAKLPKLVLPKFRGDITQWQSFWDSFNSAIHTNPQLSQIDKFNHLHSLLEGQAARAIQGLTRTDANYNSAIELLQNRFGKTQNIISTHMDELLKIPVCSGDKASQLRFVYDKISINVRGLASLGVNSTQYGSLLIPVIMSKLPQEVRIQVARNTAREVWEMSELLDVIRQEVEAREISEGVKTNVNNTEKPKQPQLKLPPSSLALVAEGGTQPTSMPGNRIKCVYCRGEHYSASCERVTDPQARFEILQRDRRCFVCLRSGHRGNSCNRNCRRCQGNHHQSICRQILSLKESSSAPNENSLVRDMQNATLTSQATENQQLPSTATTASSKTRGTVLLQTATAIATNEDGSKSTRVKILFDSGSQKSYVTDSLKSRLGLKSTKTELLHLNTFGEKNFRKQKCDVVTLKLEDRNDEAVKLTVLSFPAICSPLPSRVDSTSYPHLHGLQLADCSDSQDPVDVLVGSDHYWDLVSNEIVRGDFGPTAIKSRFGWLLSGPTEFALSNETTVANLIISGNSNGLSEPAQDHLVDTLKQFWETESIGIKEETPYKQSSDGFNENVSFNGERYEVNLPWLENRPEISSDFELCVNRLKSLQRRMLKEPELIEEYNQIIEDQMRQGIVEKVPAEEDKVKESKSMHYLPHHAVIRRDRETTKLRVVYDGSAKPSGSNHSLNDCLQTGPNYTPQLFDTLVRFRWHKIGLTADIEKAFLMVGINEADKDMLRFLWFNDPGDINSDIIHLRFTRLVFGLRPSPAILGSTTRHHLDAQISEEFKAELIERLKNSLYVDDLVTGEENEAKALDLYSRSKSIMKRGGFNLRKWNTNSRVVLEAINQSNNSAMPPSVNQSMKAITEEDESYAKATTGPPIDDEGSTDNGIVKVLGSIWDTANDQLTFNLSDLSDQAKLLPTTKRSLLKISAKIFDPLGLLSPFTIRWKVLFQALCNEHTDWDEQLKDEHLKKWNSLTAELQTLNNVRIPRCYFDNKCSQLKFSQLHCFSDASERAYAATIYLRSTYDDGHVDVNLIASKTKVAPLKKQSIPRLELLGATILVRLAKAVQNALPQKLENVYYWVDSMTVLCWIKNTKPWKQYVLSRVQEIRENTPRESWNFCPGEQNPADIPSRGRTANDLVTEKT